MKKKIIYILTNEAMPRYIKIGKTDKDPTERARELSTTGVPLPFEVFHAMTVDEDDKDVERKIHEIFADYRENPKREFFTIDPEKVKLLFELIPGEVFDFDKEDAIEDDTDRKIIEERKKQRSNFNFKMVDIPTGAKLKFIKGGESVVVKSDKNIVELNGEDVSLSAAAKTLLNAVGLNYTSAQGAAYFEYEGETLLKRRQRMESEE